MFIDSLIKIKNAQAAKKDLVKSRYSKLDLSVCELLRNHGFVKKVEVKGRSLKKIIEVELKAEPTIQGIKILSRPSRALYAGYKEMKKSKGGTGYLVVSTSRGVMTSEDARKQKVGGQLLFEIW